MSDTVTAMTEPTFGRADRSPWAPFLRLALASILAITLLAFLLPAGASARDIVIGDSSTPLSAGAAGPNFANTAVSPTSPAATQSGNCLTPNVSIGNSSTPAGPTAATDVRDAIQKAVTPASMGVQAGDNVYFCNISQSGTGAPAANTYAPAEAGNTATAVDLSGTPGITIAALPGQTPTLLANGIGTNDYRFFTDTNAQGREFTLKDLVLSQGPISTQSGGFIRVSNAVTPGKLVIDGITADEFEVNSGPPDPDGGVIAAENVEVIDSSFGTKDDNSTDGDGGAIAADGDVLVRTSKFGSREESSVNQAQADGGAIAAGGDVVVEGSVFEGNQAFADGGAIAARGRVEVTGTPSVFIGYDGGFSAADNGGAIHAQSVLVANASRFGVDTAPEPDVGIGLEADGDGGAIATYNVTAGCNDASPSTPCVPGVVEITGAATFGDNVADGNGGAIYAAGGVSINGQTSGVRFISTPNFVNEAAGGGAIALGGLFNGANTGPSPRACVASSSLRNLNLTGQKAFANGGGALHVLASATDLTDPTKRCTVGLSGSTFDSNTAAGGPGGALFIGGGNVSVTDTTFDSNTTTTSGDGGAVATGGDATNATRFPVTTITGSSFTDNQSVARGGAVANGVSALNTPQTTVSDTVLDGNTAPGGGGGISSAGPGSITVTGSELTDNTAGTTGSGGGALIAGTGNVTIESSEFLRNTAGTTSGNGGAISLNTSGATKTITGNSFSGNTAKGTGGGSGGAIYTGVSLGLTPAGSFSDNLFTQNAASAAGGAVLHQATGSMTLSDSTFQSNYAVASGGAVASTSGTLTVSQSEFQSNGSQGDGGALLGSGPGSTVLDGSSFLGNRAGVDSQNAFVAGGSGADGGAAKITSATYRVTDSSFVQNLAANDGGGVDAASNGSAAGDGVSGSDFSGNRAGAANAAQASAGGGLNLSGAFTQNVTTSEFLLNEAIQTNTNASAVTRGGAIAATGGNLNLSRSTVAGNAVSASAQVAPGGIPAAGGGLYLASAHTATSANSTFTANRAPVAAVAWSGNAGGTLTFTSSTIAGNQAPTGSSILVSAKTAAGAINVTNSVIAEGSNYGSACLTGTGGTVVNGGGNVLTETTECGGTVLVGTGGAPATKVTSARLALGALADNGGPTETMALALDSVARNSAGVNALGGSPRDQRGLARPLANQSSGAYQLVVADIDVSRAGAGQGTVVSSPAGISCGETCRSAFALNSEPGKVTLTATASTGSIFQSWTGPCASVSGNQCVVDLSSGQLVSITANFRDSSGTLTVSRAGNGEGRVTSGPGGPIDCGTQCVAELDQGSTITLTAEPLGKSTFGGWSGACAAAGKSPTCTLTMDVAKTVTATFFESARVKIKWSGDRFKVPKNRTISVGQVECVNGTCEVIQATVKVEVGGKAYRAKAKVNRDSFTEGQSRPVKVIIPKAAYRRLGKGSGSGSLKLVVRAQASLPGSFIEVNRSLNASLRR